MEKGSVVSIPVPVINVAEAETEQDVLNYIDVSLLGNVIEENKANITFSGDPKAFGYFSNTDFLKLEQHDGILLTSGIAGNAVQPNKCNTSGNVSTNNDGLTTDQDLVLLASGQTVSDVSVFEFDYRPSNDTFSLNYVFASEEYHDMINRGSHDVFGIFLSGPGINGAFSNNAENIATITAENLPVNAGTINFGPGGLTCEGTPPGCNNCEFLVNNSEKPDSAFFALAYDGYTVPMNATVMVQPGEWYHVKIAMADGQSELDDSGIFISSGTLVSDSLMTGIRRIVGEENIRVRPNPADDFVEIDNPGGETIIGFTVYDINGRILAEQPFENNRISLEGFPVGLLFIELKTKNGWVRFKVVHR